MIGMRTRAPKSSEGKMANGRETLRLRSKGAATVQEVVSPTGEKATCVGHALCMNPAQSRQTEPVLMQAYFYSR